MTSQPDRHWYDVGLSPDVQQRCECAGWSLADVLDVLGSDDSLGGAIEWLDSGYDPLEVHAAIQAGTTPPPWPGRRVTLGTRDGQTPGEFDPDLTRLSAELATDNECPADLDRIAVQTALSQVKRIDEETR